MPIYQQFMRPFLQIANNAIRDFFGALNLKSAQKGMSITTSDFPSSVQETANNPGTRIVLINSEV